MVCPYCTQKTRVTNSRGATSTSIWRRRRCTACMAIFTTSEDYVTPTIIKVQSGTSLRDLEQTEITIALYKALQQDDTKLHHVQELAKTTLDNIIRTRTAILSETELKQHVYDVLLGYSQEAALRYQLDSGLTTVQNKQA